MTTKPHTSGPADTVRGFDDIVQKEQVDIEAWARHADHAVDSHFLEHKLQKLATARTFLASLERHRTLFEGAHTILELGGGSCWASYLVKALFPGAHVVGSDIAPSAIEHHALWEDVLQSRIDGAFACRSYDVPVEDASFDLVFCFEAAHHFGKHRRTLQELRRILRPGGHALYLHEPGCRRYLYPLAHRRVNRKRPEVPEDVLVYTELVELASEAGLRARVAFDPSLDNRGPKEALYFMGLRALPVLQRLLPCTVDLVFEKPAASD